MTDHKEQRGLPISRRALVWMTAASLVALGLYAWAWVYQPIVGPDPAAPTDAPSLRDGAEKTTSG